ncbi:tetratricopeptide repeat protein [Fredinandcohnia humi]
MSKQSKKNNKIIQFPKLKERLMDKGLDALKNKNFVEALSLLTQAQELEKGNQEIELGLVICLFELGEFERAKEGCLAMLKEDIGDYFHVLQIYLMILVQLGQFGEVRSTIEAVLDEGSVPNEYYENLKQLLELSKKTLHTDAQNEEETSSKDVKEQLQQVLIEQNNIGKQLGIVNSLKELNIRKYIDIFKDFLKRPDKHPIVKTMVLQLLVSNQVDEEIDVEKFGESVKVNPSKLVDPVSFPFTIKVLSIIEEKLQSNNPTLYETAQEIWSRHLFLLYPFTLENEEASIYAAALHLYSAELHGIEIENSELEQEYGVSILQLKNTLEKLEKIESVSFIE